MGVVLGHYVEGGDGLDGREANGDVLGELVPGPDVVGRHDAAHVPARPLAEGFDVGVIGQRLAVGAHPTGAWRGGHRGADELRGYRYGALEV